MIIREIRPYSPHSKKVILRLDGAEDLVLYKREFTRLGVSEGDDLPDEVYDSLISEILVPRARRRALHLLERGDRTEADLYRKLCDGGYPAPVARDALEYVASYGYVDDERYASNYIRYHQDKRSRRRLISDLTSKGISADIIDRAMEQEFETSEADQIRRLLEGRRFDPQTADQRERQKQIRFLLGRGYSYSDIRSVMGDLDCPTFL